MLVFCYDFYNTYKRTVEHHLKYLEENKYYLLSEQFKGIQLEKLSFRQLEEVVKFEQHVNRLLKYLDKPKYKTDLLAGALPLDELERLAIERKTKQDRYRDLLPYYVRDLISDEVYIRGLEILKLL